MNNTPQPNQQEEASQPGQEPVSTPQPEIYTDERIQELLTGDAMTPDHRSRTDT